MTNPIRKALRSFVLGNRFLRRSLYAPHIIKSVYGFKQAGECSLCGYRGDFELSGYPPRFDVVCPECASFERHRLIAAVQAAHRLIGDGDAVLHFAPEAALRELIAGACARYVTSDYDDAGADLRLDIENMDVGDESYDVVVCNHVLEHVDDGAALGEIHRVLRPGGRLIATVPIVESWPQTFEDPSITEMDRRAVYFGQFDHVRFYGRDFRDRIVRAGFSVSEYPALTDDVVRYALARGETVFVGEKKRETTPPMA